MPNTRSGEKAVRQSKRKREHNLFWRRRIRAILKTINKTLETEPRNADILLKEQSLLQKVVDKAAKEKVIHVNKAKRIKSRYANKIAAHTQEKSETKPTARKSKSSK